MTKAIRTLLAAATLAACSSVNPPIPDDAESADLTRAADSADIADVLAAGGEGGTDAPAMVVDAGSLDAPPDRGAPDVPSDAAAMDVPVDMPTDVPVDMPTDVLAPCPPGQVRCDRACVALSTDLANCGACGRTCVLANAVAVCAEGSCAVAACRTGFGNCDGVAANGCEVELSAASGSVEHCGACGNRCPPPPVGAISVCRRGRCEFEISMCPSGLGDCDGVTATGCETTIATSTAHCGRCGGACSAAGGTASCVAGACQIVCAAGYFNCDGDAANGCERDAASLQTNAQHCGRCGNACTQAPSNGRPACTAGACGFTCLPGFTACGSACVDLRTTSAHCGACGASCVGAPNTAGGCAAGRCDCTTGFADCDGDRANGCEARLSTDPSHCGACGRVCDGVCQFGVCVQRRRLATGDAFTCALSESGATRWCWGANGSGQLGIGTTAGSSRAVSATVSPAARSLATLAMDRQPAACTVHVDGTVRCWGNNYRGSVGDGTNADRRTPVAVLGATDAVEATLGAWHGCLRTSAGRVQCWGSNFYGQRGDGSVDPTITLGAPITGVTDVLQVRAGAYHTCVRLADGAVRCWGPSWSVGGSSSSIRGAVSISGGADFDCALLSSGTVQCWGANARGNLGDGTLVARDTPGPVAGISSAAELSCARGTCCVRLRDRSIRCWGQNDYGQLGDGSTTDRLSPVVAGASLGTNVEEISVGDSHVCVRLVDGRIFCWGRNNDGQLGDGTTTDRHAPVQVLGLP